MNNVVHKKIRKVRIIKKYFCDYDDDEYPIVFAP